MANTPQLHHLPVSGDVCCAGDISLSGAATLEGHRCPTGLMAAPWGRLGCPQAPWTSHDMCEATSQAPSPPPLQAQLVAPSLAPQAAQRHHSCPFRCNKRTRTNKNCSSRCFAVLCRWEAPLAISRAMLTSAAWNQNYENNWPGGFGRAAATLPRTNRISMSPNLGEHRFVTSDPEATSWGDALTQPGYKLGPNPFPVVMPGAWLPPEAGRAGVSVPTPGNWCQHAHPIQHSGS